MSVSAIAPSADLPAHALLAPPANDNASLNVALAPTVADPRTPANEDTKPMTPHALAASAEEQAA